MTPRAWLEGLVASVISSVSTTVLSVCGSNASGSPLNWTQIANVAGVSGLVGACLFLKQSPIPTDTTTITSSTVKTITVQPSATKDPTLP